MAPSLSTMPAEILNMIFDYTDFVTIQIVRKVCRHLRNHIDHFPTDSKLQSVAIEVYEFKPQLNLAQDEIVSVEYIMKNQQRIHVKHQKNGKNVCRILFENREKTIENRDFASVIGNDLGLILRNQTSEMTTITIYFPVLSKLRLSENCLETFHGRFLAALTPHLESRRSPILTKEIELAGTNQESQIMKILQVLDPLSLDSIKIIFDKQPGFASPTMKIDRLIGLEQWKQAKEISIYGLNLASGIENFSHLERFVIELKQISDEDLVTLRETIIYRSSFFKRFTINYRHLKDSKRFTSSIIGKPRSWEYTAWFYIPNNNENALRIRWNPKQKWFSFECEERASANGEIFN